VTTKRTIPIGIAEEGSPMPLRLKECRLARFRQGRRLPCAMEIFLDDG
jgi:hypothetical protein